MLGRSDVRPSFESAVRAFVGKRKTSFRSYPSNITSAVPRPHPALLEGTNLTRPVLQEDVG